jgi:NADPH-dependent stearoyl-CoA 9-desaturase
MTTTTIDIEHPFAHLTPEQIEEIGKAFDELHDEVKADLDENDAAYIRGIIGLQRRLALIGRAELLASRNTVAWILGTATLGLAKILENMEIGHNILHGQWDWMNDPVINSVAWDWDTASTAEAWRHSHNYVHHTYTNIRGKDKDLGYEIMRIDPHQKWHPVYLLQPLYNALLMLMFEWGVAFHDMDLDAVRSGEKSQKEVLKDLKGIAGKARTQIVKDYVAWPLLSGLVGLGVDAAIVAAGGRKKSRRQRIKAKLSRRQKPAEVIQELIERKSFREPFVATAKANFTANIVRNLWSHAIIFCGHFPDQTYTFSQEETKDETQGEKYLRQLHGAANIEGGPLFHIISGNLGYQVEHHLFPDMPSTRYGEIAPRVREICKEYELPYNTGPFFKQWGMVNRTIVRLAFPGGKVRPKPGPYKGDVVRTRGERDLLEAKERRQAEKAAASNGSGNGSVPASSS